jgi:hypoxanthine phosphoribosyltransferase
MLGKKRSSAVPIITLEQSRALTCELGRLVRSSGYSPELIVYIETGARLVAYQLCETLGVPALAVYASRPGRRLKAAAAPFLRWIPRRMIDSLRRWEERSGVHRSSTRKVTFSAPVPAGVTRLLLVDDAADTGRTLQCVRSAISQVAPDVREIRSAVLGATTEEARGVVDYYVLTENCCLPWSSDSPELAAAQAQYITKAPPWT